MLSGYYFYDYYQKNLQGDIVRICDVNGTTVTEYTYKSGPIFERSPVPSKVLTLAHDLAYKNDATTTNDTIASNLRKHENKNITLFMMNLHNKI